MTLSWVEECLVEAWGGGRSSALEAARQGYRSAQTQASNETVYARCVEAMKTTGLMGLEDVVAAHPEFQVSWVCKRTLLHEAARLGLVECVSWLAERCEVDAAADDGGTALHHAAYYGREETARALVARGARKDATNARGEDAPGAAVAGGHALLANALRSADFAVARPSDQAGEEGNPAPPRIIATSSTTYAASYEPSRAYEMSLEAVVEREDAARKKELDAKRAELLAKLRDVVEDEPRRVWEIVTPRPDRAGLGGGASRRAMTANVTKRRFDALPEDVDDMRKALAAGYSSSSSSKRLRPVSFVRASQRQED
ncbi:hypothetical protein CTAYLR_002428 [Chrysophaeum taylorii]|uniref:Uncharacterized protein n=1 Tax=Chrysophaeum taylorii TaxID=2483200 RepID=A0AAD7UMK6_9STRA|nr:hypothetical protein CTAYLR_002428 [Chrysophaeum taylorii]